MNTKLHAVTDANGRPISFLVPKGLLLRRRPRSNRHLLALINES